jgi:hypothetical protein
LEGILIRKQLLNEFQKAKNKSCKKVWTALRIHKEKSIEIAMFKIQSRIGINDKEFDETELFLAPYYSAHVTTPSNKTVPVDLELGHPVYSTAKMPYNIINQDPETLSLIHAYAVDVISDKNFFFRVNMSDGSAWQFQTPNETSKDMWIKHINLNAARKSKQPIRGGFSNIDYGWADLDLTDNIVKTCDFKSKGFVYYGGDKTPKFMQWIPPATPTKLISTFDEVIC